MISAKAPPGTPRILVVDDDIYLLAAIQQTMSLHGLSPQTFDKPAEALNHAAGAREPFIVLADVKMPKIDGLELLRRLHEIDPELPVIMMTGHGDVAMAVAAMKIGAYDFLEKPVDEDVMLAALNRAMDKVRLLSENRRLNAQLETVAAHRTSFHGLIGRHPAMQRLYDLIAIVAREDDPVFIQGETGSGKELIARAIHDLSARRDQLFVPVNMGAIPAEMMEAELFGYEKGAFTGAAQTKIGKFEYAGHGTLFLDEFCSLPVTLQAKLLRVLEERAVCRLGSNTPIPVATRIITASNRDIEKEIKRGAFRQDLYFRINVLPIHAPALRDRRSDIPYLVDHFWRECRREKKLDHPPLSPSAIKQMTLADWPGNVRELRNHVRRLYIYGPAKPAGPSPATAADAAVGRLEEPTLRQMLEKTEREYLIAMLDRQGGRVAATHVMLGISRKSLYDKINKYRINLNSIRRTESFEKAGCRKNS